MSAALGIDRSVSGQPWRWRRQGGDDLHRSLLDQLLLARGVRHHIFSAIAVNDPVEVRRIVDSDRSRLRATMSRNEDFQQPLHFAVRMRRREMVALLVEHPELMERPVVVLGDRAVIGRPTERVQELLQEVERFRSEDAVLPGHVGPADVEWRHAPDRSSLRVMRRAGR